MNRSTVSREYRQQTLDALEGGTFDVVIIGGGITGVGCALDAVTRGLSVALIEQRDIASGTSSRSSKLFHGGLRYLEQFDFGLVNEALHERSLVRQKLAPHLVEPVPFVYPLEHRVWERAYVGAGITLYDTMARFGGSALPRQWHLSRTKLKEVFPSIKEGAFVGGIRYYDTRCDDARYALAVARTAAAEGAHILTSARMTGFSFDGDRVNGVKATCLETGRDLNVGAKVVVNATGVWTDRVESLVGDEHTDVTASKGIHIVVPKDRISSRVGFITRTPTSVLFLIPDRDFWHIGTTDTPWKLRLAHPAASKSDIDYVLAQANTVIDPPLTTEDVVGVYAGLRPLVSGDAASTAKLSREHSITNPAPGLVTIAGGKYTTYRVMAEDTIDRAFESISTGIPPTQTAETPLIGSHGYEEAKRLGPALALRYDLTADDIDRLLHRYGDETERVLSLIDEDASLRERLPSGQYLGAEVMFAVRHEGALHLDDVLTRRTRLSVECKDRGVRAAPMVAEIMAAELGWDDVAIKRELEHYKARVDAELDSQEQTDDHTADAARFGAPDIRTGHATE
ncbi:MAG: glycerol-3-phosphate dehydrogenase/oxidase [Acidimicrobiia bacterium]